MAARPIVDLPAPDSPMSPSTSPRLTVKSMPLTISCQRSSDCPSTRRPRTSMRMAPPALDRSLFARLSLTIISKPTRFVQQPIDHEIHGDGEERYGAGRKEWRDVAIGDEGGVLAHHGAPIGRRRLNSESEKRQGAYGQEDEAEPQAEFGRKRRDDVREDLARHDP